MNSNKMIRWIDEHTSPYDNDLKIALMLFLTGLLIPFQRENK